HLCIAPIPHSTCPPPLPYLTIGPSSSFCSCYTSENDLTFETSKKPRSATFLRRLELLSYPWLGLHLRQNPFLVSSSQNDTKKSFECLLKKSAIPALYRKIIDNMIIIFLGFCHGQL